MPHLSPLLHYIRSVRRLSRQCHIQNGCRLQPIRRLQALQTVLQETPSPHTPFFAGETANSYIAATGPKKTPAKVRENEEL
jgi:hypothetical protein